MQPQTRTALLTCLKGIERRLVGVCRQIELMEEDLKGYRDEREELLTQIAAINADLYRERAKETVKAI